MIIHAATSYGVLVSPDDDRFQQWVLRGQIMKHLRRVQAGTYGDTAQLTTGVIADESQLLSLVAQMDGRSS